MKPVLIINPNGSQKTTQDMVGITSRYLPNVMGWTNHKGPKMIVDRDQLYEAANQISEAVFPDASALIVAAFGDPGAKRLARSMDIPVIGIAAAAAREAAVRQGQFALPRVRAAVIANVTYTFMKSASTQPHARNAEPQRSSGDPPWFGSRLETLVLAVRIAHSLAP